MTMSKKFAFAAFGGMLAMALSACGDKGTSAAPVENGCPDGGPCMEYDAEANTLKDLRDKQVYKTVTIGEQTWMAQNMNYSMSSYSWCYNKSTSHCETYGSLYTWEAAKAVCPDGWKLPSDDDWNKLFEEVGGISNAGTALKSVEDWEKMDDGSTGGGTDEFGFAVLPGGTRDTKGKFNLRDSYGLIWSATELSNGDEAYVWRFAFDEKSAGRSRDFKAGANSVRCLKSGK